MDESNIVWPANKPAFLGGAASVAPDGRLWVLRARAYTDSVATYDVFDAQGAVSERVALPKGMRLVGHGASSVYVVRTDQDDLQHLLRFSLKSGLEPPRREP
jgi:hypothetical protein